MRKMSKKKLTLLFELCNELYEQERKKSGMAVLPYCYCTNTDNGQFLVFSQFGKCSEKLKSILDNNGHVFLF